MNARDSLGRCALALAFLTRLPVRVGAHAARDVGRAVAFFPLVGLVLGLVLALAARLLAGRVPGSVAAVLLAALLAVLSGGLHLDGLADTFDALGASGASRVLRLEILRDSRIGAHGAAALALGLLLKVTALHAVLATPSLATIVLFPAVGRLAAVPVVLLFPYARTEGLGAAFHAYALPRDALAAAAIVLVALGVLDGAAWRAALAAVLVALAFASFVARRLGGVTGDVCGAVIELAEIVFLIVSVSS